MNSTNKYYYEIDILRGVACLLVVFSHLPIYRILGSEALIFNGAIGVFLFFVIIGFIIAKTFGDQLIKIDNFNFTEWRNAFIHNYAKILVFWYRRFLRLFPALCLLFCCVGIISLRYGIKNHDVISSIIGFFRYIASFIFINNTVARLSDQKSIENLIAYSFGAGATWTLTCEILFYLLFPCVIIFKKFVKILPILFILALIAKGIAYALLSNALISFTSLYFNQFGYFDLFIIGIFIAIYHERININNTFVKIMAYVSLYTIIFPSPHAEFISYRYYLDFVFAATCLVYVASIQKNILNFPIIPIAIISAVY
jgi:peptidoglycan/LPS O-acetylase OafA/YrhL